MSNYWYSSSSGTAIPVYPVPTITTHGYGSTDWTVIAQQLQPVATIPAVKTALDWLRERVNDITDYAFAEVA